MLAYAREAGIVQEVESWTRDRKVESSIPGRSGGITLLQGELSMLTLIRCPLHIVLPHLHVKDPGHSA